MTLISRLVDRRRDPREERGTTFPDDLNSVIRYAGRLPRSEASAAVTTTTARQVPAVWRCQHLLADIVSGLPIHQFRRRGDEVPERVESSELVADPSNVGLDAADWKYALMLSALEDGNAYAYATDWDPSFRRVTSAEILDHADVSVYRSNALAPPTYKVGKREVDRNRIIHLRAFGPPPGSVCGMSPIAYAATKIGQSLAATAYGNSWYTKGGHPTAILSSEDDIDEPAARIAKERYRVAIEEDGVLALGRKWKWEAAQIDPSTAAFLEATNASAVDICAFYGIPPEMVGYAPMGGGSVTYANREQRAIDVLVFTVGWWIARVERLYNRHAVPAGEFVKIQTAALLTTDLLTRYKAHDIATRGGWRTPNETRRIEDEPPLPDGFGDEPVWPPYRSFPTPEDADG